MSIGHRIFIVEEDTILPLSQKAFNQLQSGKAGTLPKYGGQTLLIAVIIYTIHQRKPKVISHAKRSPQILINSEVPAQIQ